MKRLLATVLALAMLLSLNTVFADGITEENGIKTVLNQVSGKVIKTPANRSTWSSTWSARTEKITGK